MKLFRRCRNQLRSKTIVVTDGELLVSRDGQLNRISLTLSDEKHNYYLDLDAKACEQLTYLLARQKIHNELAASGQLDLTR